MIRPDIDDTVFAFEKKLEIKNPSDINEQPFASFIHAISDFAVEGLVKETDRNFRPENEQNFPIASKK